MRIELDSTYGVMLLHRTEGVRYADFYVPEWMLNRCQLVPGSAVHVQGLGHALKGEDTQHPIWIRPDKGTKDYGATPFVAVTRLPNKEGVLRDLLRVASRLQIKFTGIRTHGLRVEAESEVSLEGVYEGRSPAAFDESLAVSEVLQRAANAVQGTVVSCSRLKFGNPMRGAVMTAFYRTDLPVFRGSYGKVRFKKLQGFGSLNKRLIGKPVPVRIHADVARMSLTIDRTLGGGNIYLLEFNSPGLSRSSPVTRTLLTWLSNESNEPGDTDGYSAVGSARINVDAIEAVEYQKYVPELTSPDRQQLTGVVEVLFTTKSGDSINPADLQAQLKAMLAKEDWAQGIEQIRVRDLNAELVEALTPSPPELARHTFAKELQRGRYAHVKFLGEGSFAKVSLYVDRLHQELVAVKSVHESMALESGRLGKEIDALEQGGRSNWQAVPRLRDHFFDGERPVLVMDYVPFMLDRHSANVAISMKRGRHNRPGTLAEFAEMARQLLDALRKLHGTRNPELGELGEDSFIHADIKPTNIGFDLDEHGLPIWKLLDFGLVKVIRTGGNDESMSPAAGTPIYMSPEAFQRKKAPGVDIYALGVVLYQLLHHFRHPGNVVADAAGGVKEVQDFRYPTPNGPRIQGFPTERWHPEEPFRSQFPSAKASKELREIIYRMMAFEAANGSPEAPAALGKDTTGSAPPLIRYATAQAVLEDLLDWRRQFIGEDEDGLEPGTNPASHGRLPSTLQGLDGDATGHVELELRSREDDSEAGDDDGDDR